jgi:hypothetical protein
LEDAINQIYEKRNNFGNQLYQNEQQLFESRRQFDTNMTFQKEQEANRIRQAAAASAAASPSFGITTGGSAGQPAAADAYSKVDKTGANASIKAMLGTNDVNRIAREINAISNSAAYGNMMDKYKLELLQSLAKNSQYGALLSKVGTTNQRKIVGVSY